MLGGNGQKSQHWSADFVQHVRTVHFSLVAVCVALIGVVQFEKPKEVTTARYQLQEVKSAVDNWMSVEVMGSVRTTGQMSYSSITVTVDGKSVFLVGEASVLIRANVGSPPRVLTPEEFTDFLRRPLSLADFCNFWDLLYQQPRLIIPDLSHLSDTLVIMKKDGSTRTSKYTRGAVIFWPIVHVRPIGEAEHRALSALQFASSSYAYSWDEEGDHLVLSVPASEKQIDGQGALIQTHPYWRRGACSDSFAELYRATTGSQNKSFEALASGLDQEAAKSQTQSFEIFGVKFPVESASRWGIVLIVGIQLYLWIHLHELSPRLMQGDPGWDVAWIGVYRSLPARWLFFSLTTVLPLLTIALLGKHTLINGGFASWSIYTAAMSSSLLLSVLITRWAPQRTKNNPINRRTTIQSPSEPS